MRTAAAEFIRFGCLLGLLLFMTGCGAGLAAGVTTRAAAAAVAPPHATLEREKADSSREPGRDSPRIFISSFTDKRQSKKIVRSVKGYQGLLYSVTGWRIELDEPAGEVVARHVQSHLEKNGFRVFRIIRDASSLRMDGDIILLHLNKNDKWMGFESYWSARVELVVRVSTRSGAEPLKSYRVTGSAEEYNVLGARSGIEALTSALNQAVEQIPAGPLSRLAAENEKKQSP